MIDLKSSEELKVNPYKIGQCSYQTLWYSILNMVIDILTDLETNKLINFNFFLSQTLLLSCFNETKKKKTNVKNQNYWDLIKTIVNPDQKVRNI